MEVKLIEIRDIGTTVPAMAVRLGWRDLAERWLLQRGGYSEEQTAPSAFARDTGLEPYIVLWPLTGGECTWDPFGWRTHSVRTFRTVHLHLIAAWDLVKTGDVIDVEFLLGEKNEIKRSERLG